MAGAANDMEAKQIRLAFEQRERALENELDRKCNDHHTRVFFHSPPQLTL